MTFEEFKNNIDQILQSVDRIYNLFLLGGEPLLNKDLAKILDYACRKKKIINTRIITNGTIIPNNETINILRKYKKSSILLSNYSINKQLKTVKKEKLLSLFKKENIKCYYEKEYEWSIQPKVKIDNPIKDQIVLKNNYSKCNFKRCVCLSNNKIHPCALSRYINDEANAKYSSNFIDLNSVYNLKNDLITFFNKDCFDVCECCHFTNYKSITFPAIQIKKE